MGGEKIFFLYINLSKIIRINIFFAFFTFLELFVEIFTNYFT